MTRIDYAVFLLRVVFGLSMAYHGLNKVRGNGLQGTANWFGSIGMKNPRIQAILAASTEIASGLFLVAGLMTPVACSAFIALMIVAIWTVHWKVGYFIFLPNGGWEYCASILVVAAAIGLIGPGRLSIDHHIDIPSWLGLFVLPVGISLAMCHLALTFRPNNSAHTS